MRSSLTVQRGGWFHNPSELGADHRPEELLGHFVVDEGGPNVAPEAWPRHELSGWILRHEPSLPVLELEDVDGEPIGWLLGHPVDVAAAAVVTGRRRVPAREDAPDFERRFQAWLYGHGGRFATVLVTPSPRGYTDTFGALPLLFEPRARRIASSPFLLVDPGELVPDSPLIAIIDPYATGNYYPFAETCHRDASRLLPSHELDLETFEQRRIWPAGPLPAIAPADAVELVGAIVEATIEAATRAGEVVMGMTAGGDSRMMLACSRHLTDDVELFTVPHADVTGQSDLATARMISSSFGLRHRALPWVEGDEHDERRWLYRTGALAGDPRGRNSVPTYHQLATEGKRIRISGIGVELSRGYAWNRGLRRSEPPDSPTKRLTGEDLLVRVSLPRNPVIGAAARQWLEGAPDLDALDTIDLCALETTHGGWAGPITAGNPDAFVTTIFPFAHRAILEATLGLPHDYRAGDRLRRDVVAARWPDLGAIPINRVPRRIMLVAKGRRVAQLPAGAVRRIRRRRLRP